MRVITYITLIGDLLDGFPHGKGIQKFPTKFIFNGQFEWGKKCGYGKILFSNGLTYEG